MHAQKSTDSKFMRLSTLTPARTRILTQIFAHTQRVADGVKEGVLEQLPCLGPPLRVVPDAQLHKLTKLVVLDLLDAHGRDALQQQQQQQQQWGLGWGTGCTR